MSITQNKIAEHLGISRVSVARALNGHGKVSPESRRRIEEAARELGYDSHTNRAAREMIARRYGTQLKNDVIAVIMPASGAAPLRTETFFTPILDGIEMQAEMLGLDVFLHSYCKDRLPRLIQNGGVDGLVCLEAASELVQRLKPLKLPILTLGAFHDEVCGIAPDEGKGVRMVTQHLIDIGHRQIAYLGHPPNASASLRRIHGYEHALKSNGLPLDERLKEATLWGQQESGAGVARLLERGVKFSALVCHNDQIAMAAVRELEERGLRVPDDVSVTGFDDISLNQHFMPAITSIAFDRVAMGRRAVEILNESETKSARHESTPVELAIHDSTRAVN